MLNDVFDLSFIQERPVRIKAQALPSARMMARTESIALDDVVHESYVKKEDVRLHIEQNTYPVKNIKCTFVTRSLDCIVGGFGHLGCLDEKFHENCFYKKRIGDIIKARETKKATL